MTLVLDGPTGAPRRGVTRRAVLAGALGVGAVALLGACGGVGGSGPTGVPKPASGPVTVTAYIELTGDQMASFTKQIGDPYHRAHPNVTVEPIPQPQSSTQDVMQKLTTLIAGGTPPDISEGPSYASYLVGNGFADDSTLDGLVKRDHYPTDQYNPKNFAQLAVYQNHVVSMPWKLGGNSLVILCNANLFQAAGVPLPSTDLAKAWSWDDWVQAAEKLTKRTGDTVTQFGHNGLAWTIGSWPLVWQTDWVSADLKTATCDSPAMVDCYTRLQDLYYKSRVVPLPGQAKQLFGSVDLFVAGKAAMQMVADYNWSTYTVKNPAETTHIAPVPKVKISTPDMNAHGMSIVKGAQHPADAWALIQYMIQDARLNNVTQQFPARLDFLEPYLKDSTKATPNVDTKLVVDVSRTFVGQTALGELNNSSQAYDLINPKLTDLWANKVTPSAMLTGLKPQLQTIVAKG